MLRSGSICMSFLYNYLTCEITPASSNSLNPGGDELVKKGHRMKILSDTFASYGGVLAKISQILCIDEGKGDVFSDCKPFCQKETIEFLKEFYTKNPTFFENISDLDFDVYKSGSVGQTHRAKYFDANEGVLCDAIVKVQYVGLVKQFQNDLSILDMVTTYLFSFMNLSNAMIEIKTKLFEELDYKQEFENQFLVYNIWKQHDYIKIPQLIPELCNDKLLTMKFVKGINLCRFIENSTQNERNHVGKLILEFVFTNMYSHCIFYSDLHYGNFLIHEDQLFITDFGCLHNLDTKIHQNLIRLHKCMLDNDEKSFFDIVRDMEILNDDCNEESKTYMFEYFKLQYEPLITNDVFEFTDEWMEKAAYKNPDLMKPWTLPSNCVYLNKVPYALYHVFTKMRLRGNFYGLFQELLKL